MYTTFVFDRVYIDTVFSMTFLFVFGTDYRVDTDENVSWAQNNICN